VRRTVCRFSDLPERQGYLVEVDGDTAVAHTDYLFVRAGSEGLALVATGRYHDQLVRDGSRWRFRRREISLLGPPDGSTGD